MDKNSKALIEPISLTSSWEWQSIHRPVYSYARSIHPNTVILQKKIKNLYGTGSTCIFPSGMSAISTTLMAYAKPNSKFIVASELYCDTFRVLEMLKEKINGFEYVIYNAGVDTDLLTTVDMNEDAALIFMESCSNPTGKMTTKKSLKIIKKMYPNMVIVVDNSWLSPILYNPYNNFADIVVESLSKYIGGGSIIMGMATGSRKKIGVVCRLGSALGCHVSPMDCWLASQSLDSLELRMNAVSEKMQEVLAYLDTNKHVTTVYHPLHNTHENVEIAKAQLKGYPGTVYFITDLLLDGVMENLKTKNIKDIHLATSYGKAETLIDPYALKAFPEGVTIRLSIGYSIEKNKNIINDLSKILC